MVGSAAPGKDPENVDPVGIEPHGLPTDFFSILLFKRNWEGLGMIYISIFVL